MHYACPLKDLPPGDAIRLDTRPPITPPAKKPVRVHEVFVVDGDIMVTESTEAASLPLGLTVNGHV